MTSTVQAPPTGYMLTGEYLSTKPGKEWEDRDGNKRRPVIVTLLIGDRAQPVEYRDEDSAAAAVAGAERGDPLALPVFVRAKGKDWLAVSGVNLRTEG